MPNIWVYTVHGSVRTEPNPQVQGSVLCEGGPDPYLQVQGSGISGPDLRVEPGPDLLEFCCAQHVTHHYHTVEAPSPTNHCQQPTTTTTRREGGRTKVRSCFLFFLSASLPHLPHSMSTCRCQPLPATTTTRGRAYKGTLVFSFFLSTSLTHLPHSTSTCVDVPLPTTASHNETRRRAYKGTLVFSFLFIHVTNTPTTFHIDVR